MIYIYLFIYVETDREKPPLLLPPRVSCSILAGGPVRLRVTAVEATSINVDAFGFPSERYHIIGHARMNT